MIIGDMKNFKEGDSLYHKRLKKKCLFVKYIDNNYAVVSIDGVEKNVSIVFLEVF